MQLGDSAVCGSLLVRDGEEQRMQLFITLTIFMAMGTAERIPANADTALRFDGVLEGAMVVPFHLRSSLCYRRSSA